jgi:hypothetical protein
MPAESTGTQRDAAGAAADTDPQPFLRPSSFARADRRLLRTHRLLWLLPVVFAVLFGSVRLHLVVERLQKRTEQLEARRETLLCDVREKRHALALQTDYQRIEPHVRALGLRPPVAGQVRLAEWKDGQP